MNNDILFYILQFLKFDINYLLVCRKWNTLYKDMIKFYPIGIKAKTSITCVFGNIHNLNMSKCDNITSITALKGIHTLNMSYCFRITNITALKGIQTLDISGCYRITDIIALKGINT